MNSFARPVRFKTTLRAAALALGAAAGLTAVPTRAADGTLGRDGPPTAVSGADAWTLRPTRPSGESVVALAEEERGARLVALPESRRRVRVVYQGYFVPTALSVPR